MGSGREPSAPGSIGPSESPIRTIAPPALLPSVAVLAGIVVVLAGVYVAQGLVATVAFGALAAVICRGLQLWSCVAGACGHGSRSR